MSKSTGQQVSEQHPCRGKWNGGKDIPGAVPRVPVRQPDQARRLQRAAWRAPRWGQARDQAESGVSPRVGKQAEAQPEAAPGTWGGGGGVSAESAMGPHLPSCSPLLVGTGSSLGRQIMGWEGSTSLYMGTEQCCPAQPGPHQTAKHNGSLRQADNSALSGRGQPGWHPLPLCFSLAPVSESLELMTLGTMNGEQV